MRVNCRWFIRLAYDYWTPLSQRGTSEEGEGPGVRAFRRAFLRGRGRDRLCPARSGLLLTVENLVVSYGAIRALHGITIEIEQGSIVTLIGANGAGKTTTLRTISGLVR